MNLTEFAVMSRKAAQWDSIESEMKALQQIPEIVIINNRMVYKLSLASPEDVDRVSRNMEKLR